MSIREIIVTAQKRQRSINTVGMSITSATGNQLALRGSVEAADLVKVVPGFTFSPSATGSPVYTLRGVGFDESSFLAAPTVSL